MHGDPFSVPPQCSIFAAVRGEVGARFRVAYIRFVHVINGNGPGVNRHGFSRAAYLRGPSAIVLTVYFHASLVLRDQNVLAKGRNLLVGLELAITVVSLGRIGQDFDDDLRVREGFP